MANKKTAPAAKPEKKSPQAAQKKPNVFKRLGKYFRDTRAEMKKVVWPTRKQTLNSIAIVLTMIVIFTVIVGGLDWFFAWLRDFLLGLL